MKIGEIKMEALRLMFLPVGDLTPATLDEGEGDRTVGEYLKRMPGAINRALGDIEGRDVLPLCRRVIEAGEWERRGTFSLLPLSRLGDCFRVVRLYRTDGEEAPTELSVGIEGELLVATGLGSGERTVLLYRPRLQRVQPYENEAELEGVPDGIAALIPYYIKGELFREDEPNEASVALSRYETALARLALMNEERIADAPVYVRAVYSQVEI